MVSVKSNEETIFSSEPDLEQPPNNAEVSPSPQRQRPISSHHHRSRQSQGPACCGCCCDFREAVIYLDSVTIFLCLVANFWANGKYPEWRWGEEKITDPDKLQYLLGPYYWRLLGPPFTILACITIPFCVVSLVGALSFDARKVQSLVVWMVLCLFLAYYFCLDANAQYDSYEWAEHDDMYRPALVTMAFVTLWTIALVYTHVKFCGLVQQGVLSKETYPCI